MAQEILASSHQFPVPDRAGQLIVQRKSWKVTAKTNGDTVVIGHLPAGCRLHVPLTKLVFEAAVPTCDIDLTVGDTPTTVITSGTFTTGTAAAISSSDHAAAQTVGVSEENRIVSLLLNTAPGSAAGTIHAEIAYFAD